MALDKRQKYINTNGRLQTRTKPPFAVWQIHFLIMRFPARDHTSKGSHLIWEEKIQSSPELWQQSWRTRWGRRWRCPCREVVGQVLTPNAPEWFRWDCDSANEAGGTGRRVLWGLQCGEKELGKCWFKGSISMPKSFLQVYWRFMISGLSSLCGSSFPFCFALPTCPHWEAAIGKPN